MEIKFRGMDFGYGIWRYGDLTHFSNGDCAIEITQAKGFGYNTTGYCRVIPLTVGQYTGLKDKNGVEIYAGDIINCVYGKCVKEPNGIKRSCVVIYSEENACFFAKIIDSKLKINFQYIDKSSIEIMGDIYENSELLKCEGECT